MTDRLKMPQSPTHKVLLDGVPMTREMWIAALVRVHGEERAMELVVDRSPHRWEFDVAEGMDAWFALGLHTWCHDHGVETEYR